MSKDYSNLTKAELLQKVNQLEQSHQRLRAEQLNWELYFDSIDDLVVITDIEHNILYANKRFLTYHNKSKIEIKGKKCYEIMHKQNKPLECCIRNNQNKIKSIQKHQIFDKFTKKYFSVKTSCIYNEKKESPKFIEIFKDITIQEEYKANLKQQNEELLAHTEEYEALNEELQEKNKILNESQIQFKELFDNMSLGVAIYKATENFDDFILININKAACRIINYEKANILNKKVTELFPQIKEFGLFETFQKVSQTGKPIYFKQNYYSDHRISNWFENYVYKLPSGQIVSIFEDITDKKIAEETATRYLTEQLLINETATKLLKLDTLEQIFEFISQTLHHYIANSIIVAARFYKKDSSIRPIQIQGISGFMDKLTKLLKIKPSNYNVFISPEMVTKLTQKTNQLYQFSGGIYELSQQNINPIIAKTIEKLLNIKKIYSINLVKNNQLIGVVNIILQTDTPLYNLKWIETIIFQSSLVLHRLLVEEELIKAKERAEESDHLKSTFLANISHEIRTPLNGVLGFAQLMDLEELKSERQKKYVENIKISAKNLMRVISDIIDLSIIEAGQLKITQNKFNLNTVIDSIVDELKYEFAKQLTKIELKTIYEFTNEDAEIISDEIRLKIIFNHLLTNAIKFTNQGHIKIGYQQILQDDKNYLKFYVEDTGIGIKKENQAIIFDRFRQVDGSTSRQYGGTGIGLSIVKAVVDLFEGEIHVESNQKQGSTFYFSIPYHPVQKVKENQAKNKNYNWADKKVLIVEDVEIIYEFIKEVLLETNIRTLYAPNGKKAIELFENNNDIDLILMDINLPDMNGYEITNYIRKQNNNIIIIAQTAYALSINNKKAREAGFNDFLTKPINRNILLQKMNNFL